MTGCGSGLKMRVPDVKVIPARTIFLPVSTRAYELDFGDNRTEEAERAGEMEKRIGVEVERQARAKGALPVPTDRIRGCGSRCVSLLATLINWGETAAKEIAASKYGAINLGRSSVAEWQNKRDFGPLRQAVDADFALVVYVRDTRETDGRAIGNAFIGRSTHFKQVGVACAVELLSGRMVWCASVVDQWDDLTSPDEARRAVQELLAEF